MAATSSLSKRVIKLVLNKGTVQGVVQKANVDLFDMSEGSGYSDDIAVALAGLLQPILALPLYEIQKIETSTLSNS